MPKLYLRLYAAFTLVVFTIIAASAQDLKSADIKGKVTDEKIIVFHGYVAELDELVHPGQAVHCDVATDGAFTFRNIAYGDYVLRITDYYGTPFTEQFLTVREHQLPVEVALPKADARPTGARVSLRQLQHPPAAKAVNAALAGQRFAQSGNYDRAAGELRKAIHISPEYAEAHSNLAVQYIHMGQFADARVEIERAMAIAGPDPANLCNLAFVHASLQQYDQGAAAAREALRLDPNHANAHYLLGALLLLRNETRAEAIEHLQRAAPSIPAAQAALVRLTK
jgi:tetratricopeptide (TPR) repeat protein